MPRVVVFIATSADGYVAGPDDDLDWLFTDADYGYETFYAGVDAVVMGRRTYDVVLGFGGWPYAGKRGYVVSHREIAPMEGVQRISGDPQAMFETVRARAKRDVWLVGGGSTVAAFRRAGLVDRYIISVHPVLLGAGTPLFPGELPRELLDLTAHQVWPNGLVQLTWDRSVPRSR